MKYLKSLFGSIPDRQIVDSINYRNIRSLFLFSLITCLLDAVSLIGYVIFNFGNEYFLRTLISVSSCIVACIIVVFISKKLLNNYDKTKTISDAKSVLLVVFFYIAMSVWGIIVDVAHYAVGAQIITFYIVQFCFVCFVIMPPRIGSVLIAASFSALYIATFVIDKAVGIQPQNLLIFAILAVFGNLIQRKMWQETEKSKVELSELNAIFQQEATFDDLTKVKNRNALRRESNKYIGSYVYVVLADIDNFKRYNDVYGHLAGDEVLRIVATTTTSAFPRGNIYRYGGDEFLIIIPDSTDSEFSKCIETWEKNIHAIDITGIDHIVSCCYGYDYRQILLSGDIMEAINAADKKLYENKKTR